MGIIMPGVLMAILYSGYIVVRCTLQPSIAPPYHVTDVTLRNKLSGVVLYVLPTGVIVFLVIGVILLGIATPSEAAATGALGCLLLAAAYRALNWQNIKEFVASTVSISVMMLMIIVGAVTFSQILAASGVSRGLVEFVSSLTMTPIFILIGMQVIILFLGMFISPLPIVMMVLPLFMPIINSLGFEPVWFAVIMMLNLEMGMTTPPFGLGLFVMKAVAPPDTTLGDCIRAALPFLGCDLIAMILLIAFPPIVLWLPGLMS
jgi:tripartite ATP-independent transporter DctM subunit